MSNRNLKLRLYKENPYCHWCGRKTKLICEPFISGEAYPLTATIDHLISRYNLSRFVQKKKGQHRKVLSCYKCNHNRSVQETLCLSRNEILKRSKGFSLSPRGKPIVIKPLPTLKEVEKLLPKA
jgi:ribosomal protein S14